MDKEWEVQDTDEGATSSFPIEGKVGDEKILIFKVGEGLRGVQLRCPHQNAVLVKATVLGGRRIKCPLHNFIFELSNGDPVNCPGYRLKVFEVKLEAGKLYARPDPE